MEGFGFRGLEFHNNRMWKWESVHRALDFMEKYDLNALIFHQNDLIDFLVEPKAYFSEEEMWAYWPVRYCSMSTNRQYIQKVIREAKRRGIDFYLEVKEIWYPEALLDKFPHLRNENGHICPTDPFWFDFLRIKVEELLQAVPDFAGLIVSPATRESKVSISANQCTCARCRSTSEYDWYYQYLHALYEPLSKHGKKLVVRDFAYSTSSQGAVLRAAEDVSTQIIVALKNVPHDFWPVYPHNPAIERPTKLRKWIEYDVWGQYAGLGIFPCSLVQDILYRQDHCLKNGCDGIWYRTDWELLNECSCFNSLNMVNLIGAAMHAKNPNTTSADIFRAWASEGITTALREESCMAENEVPACPDAAERLEAFMSTAYEVIAKTLYVFGHVFSYSSRYQHAYQSIYNVMNVYHQRKQWDPESAALIVPTEENIARIIREKEEALALAKGLRDLLMPQTLGVSPALRDELEDILDLYPQYVSGFLYSARAYFRMRKAVEYRSVDDARKALEEAASLRAFANGLERRLAQRDYPFYLYWMADPRELLLLCDDIEKMAGTMLEEK